MLGRQGADLAISATESGLGRASSVAGFALRWDRSGCLAQGIFSGFCASVFLKISFASWGVLALVENPLR